MAADRQGRQGGRLSNRALALVCALVFTAMVGVAFAAVPFYRAFCQATGFDGTPRRVIAGPAANQVHRTILVRFDANVRGLPWRFAPVVGEQSINVGSTSMAYFTVKNLGTTALTGRATYNISPESAAPYFLKLQCFCFNDQSIPAGVEKTFPVVYYVDPKFAKDPDNNALQELTLSYTFFPAPDVKAQAANKG